MVQPFRSDGRAAVVVLLVAMAIAVDTHRYCRGYPGKVPPHSKNVASLLLSVIRNRRSSPPLSFQLHQHPVVQAEQKTLE